jgi:hypothetical protein
LVCLNAPRTWWYRLYVVVIVLWPLEVLLYPLFSAHIHSLHKYPHQGPLTTPHEHSRTLTNTHNHYHYDPSRPLATGHDRSPSLTTTHDHSRPLTTTHNQSRTLAASHDHSMIQHSRPLTITHDLPLDHLQSLATNSLQLTATQDRSCYSLSLDAFPLVSLRHIMGKKINWRSLSRLWQWCWPTLFLLIFTVFCRKQNRSSQTRQQPMDQKSKIVVALDQCDFNFFTTSYLQLHMSRDECRWAHQSAIRILFGELITIQKRESLIISILKRNKLRGWNLQSWL